MTEMSPATALRKLEQAKAGLRNARKAMKMLRTVSSPSDSVKNGVFTEGWTSLALAQRLMGEIPAESASEDVMTRQLAVQRVRNLASGTAPQVGKERFPRRGPRPRRRRARFRMNAPSPRVPRRPQPMGRPRPEPEPPNEPMGPSPVFPDRSLETAPELPVVSAPSDGRHPWIYKKMVLPPTGPVQPRDGDLVRMVDREGLHLGFGLWNRRSQIAVRLLERGQTPPGLAFWTSRIKSAVSLRRETLALESSTSAYRVINSEGDGLPGLIVDRYDDVLSVEVFSLGIYQRIGPILALISEELGTKHAVVRVDERIAIAEDFSGAPLATKGLPPKVAIHENGIRYRVKFAGGHKTGFFCDQRDNRKELTRFCRDRSVLDVCCYSGGFGLQAQINGGAKDVTCIDLDETALAMAKDNANANQVRLNLIHADAFGFMRQMRENGRSYGVLVLDPPKLIPNRDEIAAGKRKYFDLNVLALRLVEENGIFLTCSCSGLLSVEEFLPLLRAAARRAGRETQLLALNSAASDHPVSLEAPEGSYLKAAWIRVGPMIGTPTENSTEPEGAGPSEAEQALQVEPSTEAEQTPKAQP